MICGALSSFPWKLLLMINIGLLLLRAAGFMLAFTFGIQKIGWYVTAFRANLLESKFCLLAQ